MVLLGFTVLKEKLLDHSKCQTIRSPRKRPFKVGDKLQIYWKPRTKQCEKLGEARITAIERRRFEHLEFGDALRDGFSNLKELQSTLLKMHHDKLYTIGDKIYERYPHEGFDIITFEWSMSEEEQSEEDEARLERSCMEDS